MVRMGVRVDPFQQCVASRLRQRAAFGLGLFGPIGCTSMRQGVGRWERAHEVAMD